MVQVGRLGSMHKNAIFVMIAKEATRYTTGRRQKEFLQRNRVVGEKIRVCVWKAGIQVIATKLMILGRSHFSKTGNYR
jgi:hypothetical protein